MALVRYNGKNILYFNFTKKFFPGINEVTESELVALQNHPLFVKRFESGVLELIKEEKKKSPSIKENIKLIQEVYDVDLLKKMMAHETRAQILEAMKTQIDKLTPKPKKEDEEFDGDI